MTTTFPFATIRTASLDGNDDSFCNNKDRVTGWQRRFLFATLKTASLDGNDDSFATSLSNASIILSRPSNVLRQQTTATTIPFATLSTASASNRASLDGNDDSFATLNNASVILSRLEVSRQQARATTMPSATFCNSSASNRATLDGNDNFFVVMVFSTATINCDWQEKVTTKNARQQKIVLQSTCQKPCEQTLTAAKLRERDWKNQGRENNTNVLCRGHYTTFIAPASK